MLGLQPDLELRCALSCIPEFKRSQLALRLEISDQIVRSHGEMIKALLDAWDTGRPQDQLHGPQGLPKKTLPPGRPADVFHGYQVGFLSPVFAAASLCLGCYQLPSVLRRGALAKVALAHPRKLFTRLEPQFACWCFADALRLWSLMTFNSASLLWCCQEWNDGMLLGTRHYVQRGSGSSPSRRVC